MSTITDALKKREKEVGQEEVQEIVPVSLDEPDVPAPKDKAAKRVAGLAAILVILVAIAVGAVILYAELRAGKGTEQAVAQAISLPEPEAEVAEPAVEMEDLVPSPSTPDLPVTPTAPGSVAPESPELETGPLGATNEPRPQMGADQTPPAGAPTGAEPNVVEETPIVPPPDPFAGIALQGIIRFDPTSPEVLINGKALKVGDSINGIEVVEIGEESVKLRYGSIERVIGYE